jgi:DNA-binding Lrp family transcriptional regulator
MELEHEDRLLLEEIQQDFPLTPQPFEVIGKRCGLSEAGTIGRIRNLISSGIIRDIAAILDAEKIGYKSTLVAAKVKPELVDALASRINLHPGVSHNYLRNHRYNMWFTLALHEGEDFQSEIESLIGQSGVSYLILPAIRKFKVRVGFKLSENSSPQYGARFHDEAIRGMTADSRPLEELDRKLMVMLQKRMEIVPDPWSRITKELALSQKELFTRISVLKSSGAIRRISGVLRHRRVGFSANGMACFIVREDAIEQAGMRAAEFTEVSHCYQRRTYPDWPYSLFAMVHGKEKEETDSIVREIAGAIGCNDYITLYSSKELKKERVKYFKEPE